MIPDMTIINRDEEIEFIGFNVEQGKIISEKIYRKKNKSEALTIDNTFVQKLLSSAKGLRLFSEENASCERGIIKYDFQVEHVFDWIKARHFLRKNDLYFNQKLVAGIESISWLRTMFTTIGVRFVHNEIQDIELYYRCRRKKEPRLCRKLRCMLPKQSVMECQGLMHLMFSNGAWVRLVAVDFQLERQYIKIYFETSVPSLSDKIKEHFTGTANFEPINQILEYAKFANILFAGVAIVMDVKSESIRYNFYFTQDLD